MKICFFIYNISSGGGSERVTSVIANELSLRGYDVSILSICGSNKGFYEINDKVKLHTIFKDKYNVNSKSQYLKILYGSLKFHKNNKTDLVIDVFASRSLITIPVKLFLPIKNISWEHFNYSVKEGLNPLGRKLACRFSNEIITLTNEDIGFYKNDNKKINANLNYIYNPTPYEKIERSELNSNIVISIGRLTYQKGYDRLLEVWKLIHKKCDWMLYIIGDGEDKDKLKNKCIELNLKNINFVGQCKEVSEYYKQASIYISTSRFEGLPMCMIEAQSFGLPIISFNCKTGPSEIISNDISGYLLNDNDINDMADKILELMKDREVIKHFGENALIESKRFAIGEIINKWEAVINKYN